MTNEQAIRKFLPQEHAQWVIDRWDEGFNNVTLEEEYDSSKVILLQKGFNWGNYFSYMSAVDDYFQEMSDRHFNFPELPKPIKPEDVEVGKLFKVVGEDGWYLRVRTPSRTNIIAVPYPKDDVVNGLKVDNDFEVTQIKDAPEVD